MLASKRWRRGLLGLDGYTRSITRNFGTEEVPKSQKEDDSPYGAVFQKHITGTEKVHNGMNFRTEEVRNGTHFVGQTACLYDEKFRRLKGSNFRT